MKLNPNLHFIIFILFLSTNMSASESNTHLFILSGQSNMARLKPEISFTPAVEKEFGANNTTVVKFAKSGAPIRGWVKDYQYPDKRKIENKSKIGLLYKNLITAVHESIKGKKIKTVTFIWMQGERDAKEMLSEVYKKSFNSILSQIKKDLNITKLNLVLGRISDFDMEDKKYKHWTKIRKIQEEIANQDTQATWVDTDTFNNKTKNGIAFEDLHYTEDGYKELGKRFAEEAITLIKKKK